MVRPNGFQHTQNTYGIHVGGELRCVERHLHMALCGQVVDLRRLYFSHQFDQRHRVAHIGIVQVEMRFALQMSYTLAEIHRTATDDTVHFVALIQQKLRQVTSILAGNTCY